MFKVQSKYKSMDINKNLEQYKFFPTPKNLTNYKKSFSESKRLYNTGVINKEDKMPPIYFYRKVNAPYKYNISSIPEYLIKTNEEKRFIDKLYNSINNDKEKKILDNLLNKKNANKRKDYYKPKILDLHNALRYKPELFPVSFIPEKTKDKRPKNIKLIPEINNKIKEDLNYKNHFFNTDVDVEKSNSLKESKTHLEIKNEISPEKQIKYKYKLSDIFNLHNDSIFTDKSAEKYLFKHKNIDKEREENKFYILSESNSDWIPNKQNQKKMGTNSSVAYNIITPMYKGTNRFITAAELNKNNLYNESPSFRRIKSISEFIDLTRVSATNTLQCFNRKNRIPDFKFKNMVATDQADEFYNNRNLIEKPI